MSNYSMWQEWIIDNIPFVLMLGFAGASIFAWMFNRLLNQHKELEQAKNVYRKEIAAQEKVIEETAMQSIVKEVQHLVRRIEDLFNKHDNHDERIGMVEKRVDAHLATCNERAKLVAAIHERQSSSIIKYDKILFKKYNEPCINNRTDMEN